MVNDAPAYAFTVIIPTYNRAANLKRCLDSLARQTYKAFEVIICDDGSTDDTKAVVESYKDALNIRYFYEENWGGPARPRNAAINNTTTEWVFFVDSDDSFTNDKIAFFANLDLSSYDLLYHDLSIVKDGNVVNRVKSRQLKTDAYHDLLYNLNAIPTSAVLVRTKLLVQAKGFSEDRALIAVEDFDLWIRLCESGNVRTKYIPKVLGYYSLGDDNITSTDSKQIERFKALYEPYIAKAKNKQEANRIKGAFSYQVGRIYALSSDKALAKEHFFKALKLGSPLIKFKSIYGILRNIK